MTVTIRPALPEDAPAIAAVRIASWRAAYRGIVPDSHLDAMTPEESADRWRAVAAGEVVKTGLFVSEEDGRIVGFAAYGPARPPDFGYGSELYAAYFLPEAMGRGIGSRIVSRVARALEAQGFDDMIVWVMEANARGQRFYRETMGGARVPGSRRNFDIDGVTIFEVAYGFRPLTAVK